MSRVNNNNKKDKRYLLIIYFIILFYLYMLIEIYCYYHFRHWEEKPNYYSFGHEQLGKNQTDIRVLHQGFDGNIIGYRECLQDHVNLSSTNSTSFQRAFGSAKNFVRGSPSQFPFAPGGLEVDVVIKTKEEMEEEEGENINNEDVAMDLSFLEQMDSYITAPGFERGLRFDDDDQQIIDSTTTTTTTTVTNNEKVFNIEDMFNITDNSFDFLETKVTEEVIVTSTMVIFIFVY